MRKAIHGTVILLALLLLPAAQAVDMQLGTIEARSEAGEPVDARIPIRDADPDELVTVDVGLATARTFSRAGLERPPELSALQFRIVTRGPDAPYIQISSDEPIDLELLDFLMELRWPEGGQVREYTLLLDPPTLAGRGEAPVTAEGADLTDGQVEEVEGGTAEERRRGRRGATAYGPIESGDTLWSIARENRPSDDVSVAQTMMAILEENPHAFRDGNVNRMVTGYWLRMPSEEQIRQRSAAQAQADYEAQLEAWRTRPEPPEEPVAEPEPEPDDPAPDEAPEPERVDDLDARLEVLAPDDVDGEELVALLGEDLDPNQENIERLQRELALMHEDRESLRAERDDLEARVDELTARVEDLERLLELRAPEALPPAPDEERDIPVPDMPAPPVDPPPSETVPDMPATEVAEPREPEEPEEPEEREPRPEEEDDEEEAGLWTQLFAGDIGPMEATREAWDDPSLRYALLIGGGIGLLAVAGLLGAVQKRRKRRQEQDRRQGLRLGPDDLNFDFENMGDSPAAAAPQDDEDVIDRAQRHLDQGDARSARQELLNGIEAQPARSDIRLKLMEVQADLDDRGGFNEQAQALRSRVRSESDPIWQAALAIGQRFTPPLPQLDDDAADEGEEKPELEDLDLGLDEDAGEEADEETFPEAGDDEDDLEQRLDEVFGPGDDDGFGAEEPADEGAAPDEEEDDAGWDWDDGSDDWGDEAEAEAGEETRGRAGEQPGGELEDMDLESLLSEGDGGEDEADAGEEPELAGEAAGWDEEEDDEPTPPGAGEGDEVDTKLDLARAYVDLGDEQGARELLEEALEEGTESQKSTARRLLSELTDEE